MSPLVSCYHTVHLQRELLHLAHRAIHLEITCYFLNLVFPFTLTLNTHLDLMISFQFISAVASGQLLFTSSYFSRVFILVNMSTLPQLHCGFTFPGISTHTSVKSILCHKTLNVRFTDTLLFVKNSFSKVFLKFGLWNNYHLHSS